MPKFEKSTGYKMKSSPTKLFGSRKRKARREKEEILQERRDDEYIMGETAHGIKHRGNPRGL